MASHPTLFTIFLLFIFTTLFLTPSTSTSQNVTLSLYYETLCPYCADFIVNHLVKVFDKGLISIVNLRLIPWGNAFIQPDGSFVCQVRHFRFIHCVEKMSLENKMNEWVNCFGMSGLGKAPVDCYTRGYGEVLEKKYAAETAKLNPPHRFVPWVVVNNQPLREDFENFVSHVCKAYRGTNLPEACKSLPRENNSLRKEKHINSVCFVDQTSNLTSSAPVIN